MCALAPAVGIASTPARLLARFVFEVFWIAGAQLLLYVYPRGLEKLPQVLRSLNGSGIGGEYFKGGLDCAVAYPYSGGVEAVKILEHGGHHGAL